MQRTIRIFLIAIFGAFSVTGCVAHNSQISAIPALSGGTSASGSSHGMIPAIGPVNGPQSFIRPHIGESRSSSDALDSHNIAGTGRHVRDVNGILPATTINVLWDTPRYDGIHHLTLNSPPQLNGLSSLGQTWYIAGSPVAGTQPVYTDQSGADRMDSSLNNEGGYSLLTTQGYAYSSSSAAPGISQLTRYSNPSTGAHATLGNQGNTSGWNAEPQPFYGWARYNSRVTLQGTTTSGGIKAVINLNAGGSFYSWTWNGVQFVNTADNGREIQSDFFCDAASGCSQGWAQSQNPNEAGDYIGQFSETDKQHGSPVLSASVSTNEISTTTLPLEWNPSSSNETPALQKWQSYIYPTTQISKDVQFGFGGMPGVAKYTTTFTVPTYLSSVAAELPTGYLQANVNTFFSFDAGNNTLSGPLSVPICPQEPLSGSSFFSFRPGSGYGGVIISTPDQSAAMGVYGRLRTVGGVLDHFDLWDYSRNSCPAATNKWAAVYYGAFSAGANTASTYIVTGSVIQVRQWMSQLYAMGAY